MITWFIIWPGINAVVGYANQMPPHIWLLRIFSEFGAGEWIGCVLLILVPFLIWKRRWISLLTLIIVVPGGMFLNELIKIIVHRQRPLVTGWFVNWSGYSFPSGHTIGATLLYGQLLLFIWRSIRKQRWRMLIISTAALLVGLVGFSRIELRAHYPTDVAGAILIGITWLLLINAIIETIFKKRMLPHG